MSFLSDDTVVKLRIKKEMAMVAATALAPQLEQYARLIDEATPASIQEAVDVARQCIRTCSNRAVGYELLGRALCLQRKFGDAVACYKSGACKDTLLSIPRLYGVYVAAAEL